MAFKSFSKDYTDPKDRAWREGKSPYSGTLGPNKRLDIDSFKDQFVADLKDNPDYSPFYQQAFSADTAQMSQDKLNRAYQSTGASFLDERDNQLANDFLLKYSEAISRGLVKEDEAVSKENFARLVTQSATEGSNERDPNTVSRFPNQGVTI